MNFNIFFGFANVFGASTEVDKKRTIRRYPKIWPPDRKKRDAKLLQSKTKIKKMNWRRTCGPPSRLLNLFLPPPLSSFLSSFILLHLSKTRLLRMRILRIASLRVSFWWLVAIMGVGPTRLRFFNAGARVAEDERR